jgi:hypothetical protein
MTWPELSRTPGPRFFRYDWCQPRQRRAGGQARAAIELADEAWR